MDIMFRKNLVKAPALSEVFSNNISIEQCLWYNLKMCMIIMED